MTVTLRGVSNKHCLMSLFPFKQVQKELEKAQREERKLREELDKHKKQEDWKKKQVMIRLI